MSLAPLAHKSTEADAKGHARDKAAALKELQHERNQVNTVTIHAEIARLTPQVIPTLVGLQTDISGEGHNKILLFTITGQVTEDLVSPDLWSIRLIARGVGKQKQVLGPGVAAVNGRLQKTHICSYLTGPAKEL